MGAAGRARAIKEPPLELHGQRFESKPSRIQLGKSPRCAVRRCTMPRIASDRRGQDELRMSGPPSASLLFSRACGGAAGWMRCREEVSAVREIRTRRSRGPVAYRYPGTLSRGFGAGRLLADGADAHRDANDHLRVWARARSPGLHARVVCSFTSAIAFYAPATAHRRPAPGDRLVGAVLSARSWEEMTSRGRPSPACCRGSGSRRRKPAMVKRARKGQRLLLADSRFRFGARSVIHRDDRYFDGSRPRAGS